MIFIRRPNSMIIFPLSQIVYIENLQNELHIAYHSGHFESVKFRNEDENKSIVENYSDITFEKLIYKNVKEVIKELSNFYKAIERSDKVFCFNVVNPGRNVSRKRKKDIKNEQKKTPVINSEQLKENGIIPVQDFLNVINEVNKI